MAHYSPYPGWPATAGVYPAMLQQQMQQQMAAVAASVTSQQSSSPSNQARAAIEVSDKTVRMVFTCQSIQFLNSC